MRTKKGVYTVLQGGSKSREKLVDEFGEEFVKTAERLRKRIGYRGGGEREVFLCHGFCELGAIPAKDALASIRDFLVANPHEVVLISVEDDTSPEDTARVFKDSGLLELVYKERIGLVWPTLRRLIDRNERVLVMAEDKTGGIPWYRPQFELLQETPFKFESVAALAGRDACELNRGKPGNRLFMINTWVDTSPAPKPTNAKNVNPYRPLLERARTCSMERRLFPNLVPIDFYGEGDVTGVTDTLNREPPPSG